MKNTRTIKELLTVMLENQGLFQLGLCLWIDLLLTIELISMREYDLLREYIKVNKPITFRTLTNTMFNKPNFYWLKGNIKPRIKWIKRHIKKNS